MYFINAYASSKDIFWKFLLLGVHGQSILKSTQ